MKAPREYHEGPEAAERFTNTLRKVLSVSKEEYKRREADYQAARQEKKSHPKKRAPK